MTFGALGGFLRTPKNPPGYGPVIAPPRYTAAPLFGDLLSVFQALVVLSAWAYQRRAIKGFMPPKLPKLDLTTDAECVANLANVNMWL